VCSLLSCVRNCSVHLYSDNLQLYFVNKDKSGLTDMVACVNDDLARICSWSLENSLVLNPGKTQSILISQRVRSFEEVDPIMLNNEMVQCSDVVKNLDLLIDHRLSWNNQVSHSCASAAFSVFVL
jgi:hypothetical protein